MTSKKKSKALCARISDADQERLWKWFAGFVDQATTAYGVEAFEILHPRLHKTRRKDRPVVQARRDVVLATRNTVWWMDILREVEVVWDGRPIFTRNQRVRVLLFHQAPYPPRDAWRPISYPMLAALFVGCDHSTMLYIYREAVKQAAEAAAEQSGTESTDGRNGNDDSSVCGRGDSGDSDAGQSGAESHERACEACAAGTGAG